MSRNAVLLAGVVLSLFAGCSVASITKFTSTYDRFKDRTSVTSKAIDLHMGFAGGNGTMRIKGFCPGNSLAAPDTVALVFMTMTSDHWQFLESHDLYVIIDGERMSLGTLHWDGECEPTAGYVYCHETLIRTMPMQLLDRIANCRVFELRLGFKEMKFEHSELEAFREFIARLNFPNG